MIDFEELKRMRITERVIDIAGFKEFKYDKKSKTYEMLEKVNNNTYHYFFELVDLNYVTNSGVDITTLIDIMSNYLKNKKRW